MLDKDKMGSLGFFQSSYWIYPTKNW
jgi:hypothetical protein